MPLKAGDRIDRYVIDGLLGSGGMGEVYRAHDPRLKRAVALKILHVQAPVDVNAKTSAPLADPSARMVREAQLAASLDHPNVVAIFDVGQVDQPAELQGTTYLAMELIRGEPLRAYVGDPSVKMKTRVRWLEETARALGAAHAAGLVHRDMKPENVMIREDGIVKVLDFGVAKRAITARVDPTSSTEGYTVSTMTAQGAVVGTPLYMAPEQLRAENLDGRTDQFAWAVMAYELMTGKPPWSLEGGGFSLVAQILQATAPSLDGIEGVPPQLPGVVARAMAKDPTARFASMTALLEELTGRTETGDTVPRIPVATGSGDVATSSASTTGDRALETQRSAAPRTPEARGSDRAPGRLAARRRGIALSAFLLAAVVVVSVLGVRARRSVRASAPAARGSAGDVARARACSKHSDCSGHGGGKPFVCSPSGACVAVESEDCAARYETEDLRDDRTVWLGAIFPRKGDAAAAFQGDVNAIDLARREIAETAAVLQGSTQPPRRIALVLCDDGEDPTRAARHLVDLGVPGVVGFASGRELITLANTALIPGRVLSIASVTTNPTVTRLPQPADMPRMVWRTVHGLPILAHATARLVHEALEPLLGQKRVKVVVVRDKTAGGVAFAEGLFRDLVFNGKPAVQNGPDYQETILDSPDLTVPASNVASFAPSIAVFFVNGVADKLVPMIEAQLPRGAPRPLYVVVSDSTRQFADFVGVDASRRHRIFGVQSADDVPANARFVVRFNSAYPDAPVTRALNPSGSYDAFYLLAYGIFALGDAAIDGPAVGRAFERLLPPGTPVEVGPTDLPEGLRRLREGGRIDLTGAASPLDFDPTTGESTADFVLSCPATGADGRVNGDVEAGVAFRAATRTVEGKVSCPP